MALTVHQALAAIIGELPAIGKNDKSPQGYSYRGIEAVTKHLQPLLAKHCVVISPRARITNVVPSPAMKEGWQDVYMEVEWTITGPDGSQLQALTNGIGRDNSDKGSNKSQTQAYKYLLLHLLCIADAKDDADSVSYDHGRDDEIPATDKRRVKPSKAGPALPAATDNQYAYISSLIEDLNAKEKAALLAWWSDQGFGSLKHKTLSAAHADEILAELERVLEARKEATGTGDPPPKTDQSTGSPVLPLPAVGVS